MGLGLKELMSELRHHLQDARKFSDGRMLYFMEFIGLPGGCRRKNATDLISDSERQEFRSNQPKIIFEIILDSQLEDKYLVC